jgi:hypothetical protein
VEVFLRDTLVASGADSVNAVVSLAGRLDQGVRFVFVASNAAGASTRAETGEFRVIGPDVPPSLEIVHPDTMVGGHYRILTSRVRLKVECPAPPGCVSVTAFLGETAVARGTSALDTVVSLAGFPLDTARFRFEGVNRHGTVTTVRTALFDVETDPRWTEILTLPGTLKDVTADQVVYETGWYGRQLHLLNRRTGADTVLAEGEYYALPWVGLIPSGYVVATPSAPHLDIPGSLREFGGSNVRASHFGLWVRGRSVVWQNPDGAIHRDDVLAQRLTRTPNVLWAGLVGPSALDVAEDGTVAYTGHARGDDRNVEVYLFRPGGEAERITSTPDRLPTWPRTDGTNVIYTTQLRYAGIPQQRDYQLMLHTPGGKVALTPVLDQGIDFHAYGVSNAWAVYGLTDHPSPRQVWARSPSGEVRRITPWAEGGRLVRMGPAGQVLLERNGDYSRVYLAETPFSPLVEMPKRGEYRWIDGRLHVMIGSSLIRIDL